MSTPASSGRTAMTSTEAETSWLESEVAVMLAPPACLIVTTPWPLSSSTEAVCASSELQVMPLSKASPASCSP